MRFFKDSKKIYLDSAKAGPLYYELLKWRNDYEKKSLIDKSQIRVNHENFVKDVEKSVSEFFKVDSGDVFFTNSFSRGFHSLVSKINGKPLFIMLENDYPSISESLNDRGFEIIYIKNDAYIEKNIEVIFCVFEISQCDEEWMKILYIVVYCDILLLLCFCYILQHIIICI